MSIARTFPRTHTSVAWVGFRLVLGSMCAAFVGGCLGAPSELAAGDRAFDGPGIFASAVCPAEGVERVSENEVCAACERREVCGAPEEARCEAREDVDGAPCHLCSTNEGEILFDSCLQDSSAASRCESSPADPSIADDGLECSTCTDEAGAVVLVQCEPVADECHDVVDGTRTCRECTRGGDVVSTECDPPDIAPRTCERYGNGIDSCTDCFDAEGNMLSHVCVFGDAAYGSCVDAVTEEGVSCSWCVDTDGNEVGRDCAAPPAESEDTAVCALLQYAEQSCVVCVEGGAPTLSICTGACGEAGGECNAPQECAFTSNEAGDVCRVCPQADEEEQQCVNDAPHVVCENRADADSAAASCFVCYAVDGGDEVFRRCDGT